MLRLALTLAAAALLALPAPAFAARIVRVTAPTPAERELLFAVGLDVTEYATADEVDVVLHDDADAATLDATGLSHRARPRSAARTAAAEIALPSGRVEYRQLADYGADLRRLADEHPGTVALVTAPVRSLEGRPIEGVEITEDVAARDGKPVLLVLGLHHAREWPSGELSIEWAIDLARAHASGDPRVTALLRRARVIVLPVVNPDGYDVSRRAAGGDFALKRRNCRLADFAPAAPGACGRPEHRRAGVDLNRNYDGFWGGPGASADPTSDTYRGPAPFSEPEAEAVRRVIAERQVVVLLTNHTYGAMVLRPPGVADGPRPADEALYRRVGDSIAEPLGYASRPAYELYETTGTTEDWSHFATGGLGYTIEFGDGASPTPFHPPFPAGVVAEWPGTREAFLRALEATADPEVHGVIAGRAPAGQTIEVRMPGGEPVASAMQAGPAGTFALHVNPSTRPLAAASGLTEAWRLRCLQPGGGVLAERDVVVGRGERVDVGAACRAGDEASEALTVRVTVRRLRVRALRSRRGARVRVRCSIACRLKVRVRRGGRTMARGSRSGAGRVRIRATRRLRRGRARLVVTARDGGGRRVVVRRRIRLR